MFATNCSVSKYLKQYWTHGRHSWNTYWIDELKKNVIVGIYPDTLSILKVILLINDELSNCEMLCYQREQLTLWKKTEFLYRNGIWDEKNGKHF